MIYLYGSSTYFYLSIEKLCLVCVEYILVLITIQNILWSNVNANSDHDCQTGSLRRSPGIGCLGEMPAFSEERLFQTLADVRWAGCELRSGRGDDNSDKVRSATPANQLALSSSRGQCCTDVHVIVHCCLYLHAGRRTRFTLFVCHI